VSERIQLVEDIWDSIAQVPDAIELSEAQRLELDKRLDAYRRDLSQGRPGMLFEGEQANRV
jgi:putative addiction module component (TIGR02574 family)